MTVEPYSIWWAEISFAENPDQKKRRPVLVIDPRNNIVICLRMTSTPRKVESDFVIMRWEEAGLYRETVINTQRRIQVKPDDLLDYIGNLHVDDISLLNFKFLTP
jgi:mRNA-degrading endonuclease toxin of MazEF toxin-antitoxin module